jgi:hypothetical protein
MGPEIYVLISLLETDMEAHRNVLLSLHLDFFGTKLLINQYGRSTLSVCQLSCLGMSITVFLLLFLLFNLTFPNINFRIFL